MRYTKSSRPLVPRQTAGHLYYARIASNFGPLYKIGFTSLSSVEARFAYKGNGDEQLIDKVLLFAYDREAYFHEAKLHGHFCSMKAFGTFSNNPAFPLYQNGQSELYYTDILELDDTYTVQQGQQTLEAIRLVRNQHSSNDMHWAARLAILVLASPFRLLAVVIEAGIRLCSVLGKERPAVAPINATRPSLTQQRYDREIRVLLEWVRANKIADAVSLRQTGPGAIPTVGAVGGDSIAFRPAPMPAPGPTLEPVPAPATKRIPKATSTSRFLCGVQDIRASLLEEEDLFERVVLVRSLLLFAAGAFLGKNISEDEFGDVLPLYQEAAPAFRDDEVQLGFLFDRLDAFQMDYGFDLSDNEQLAIIELACAALNKDDDSRDALSDAAIVEMVERKVCAEETEASGSVLHAIAAAD